MLNINEVKFEEVKNYVSEKADSFGQLLQTGSCTAESGACERPVGIINK